MNARVPGRERAGGPVSTCHFRCEMEELHDAYDMKQELHDLQYGDDEAQEAEQLPRVPAGDGE